jgi:Predicted membrane protein (DUF2232)
MPARHILLAAGAGVAGALFFAAWLTGSLWALALTYMAPLPLFAAGFSLGVKAALIAVATGIAAVFAAGGFAFALFFAVVNALPVVLITRQALLSRQGADGRTEWYPPGLLVMTLAYIAAAAFVLLLVLSSGMDGGLEGYTRATLTHALKLFAPPDMPEDAMPALAAVMARYMPGLVAVTWIQMIAISAVFAQALVSLLRKNMRPSPRMSDIALPQWLSVAAAIAAIGAFMPGLSGFLGANLLLIALAAFVFAGFAVIHTAAATWSAKGSSSRIWLVLVYAFTLAFTWPAVLVAVLGVADTSIGLRRRFKGYSPES